MRKRKGNAVRRAPPLRAVYQVLYRHFGPQHWWPGRTRLEIVVGAILTQNTAWSNVERAIARLRRESALNFRKLHATPLNQLAEWIRPAGYYRIKAQRLRNFTTWLQNNFRGDLRRLFALPTGKIRAALLSVSGIGPETADSIMLYAAGRPVFVVDAYTRRFLERHEWLRKGAEYDEIAQLFASVLPAEARLYNEFHALIVALGKTYCRSRALCERCPLRFFLPRGKMGVEEKGR
jgi:endonuclease-3 related protein